MQNPVLNRGTVPDFNAIRAEHFVPAMRAVLANAALKMAALKNQTESANFDNVILPLESLFDEVEDVERLLRYYATNAATLEIMTAKKECDRLASGFRQTVFQDTALGVRFQAVWEKASQEMRDDDDKALLITLNRTFKNFGGSLDSNEKRAALKRIDDELISQSALFKENLQGSLVAQAVLVTDESRLAGLGEDEKSALQQAAQEVGKTGWLIVPERTFVDGFLERAADAGLRKQVYEALKGVGKTVQHNNSPVLKEMNRLRHERAQLLDYETYADYAREKCMYKDRGEILKLLHETGAVALKKFEQDMRELEAFAAAHGGPAELEPSDVPYWVAQQKKVLCDFDSQMFTKYLELESVLDGLFLHCKREMGLSFQRSNNYPVLHSDIRTYDVFNEDGEHLAIIHFDLFGRSGVKDGGAWVEMVSHRGPGKPAVLGLNMNLLKPEKGKICLSVEDVGETLYHEMGHDLHALLGFQPKYRSQRGMAGPADFTEFFSTINENWAFLPDNIRGYARHCETGTPIPQAMMDAYEKSQKHFKARFVLLMVQNSLWDIAFHMTDPAQYRGDEELEKAHALVSPYAAHIRPYNLTRFDHPFDDEPVNIYAAGYCNYFLAEILAYDGFEPFRERGAYDPDSRRKLFNFYSGGSGGDFLGRYTAYRGAPATPEAMLRKVGLWEPATAQP
jgi:peptidyl-dipeptidase Dcp